MSKFKIEYQNNELIYWIDHQDISRLNVNPEDNNQFLEWINTYNQALKESNNKKVLLKIGQEIFYWLDGDNCSIEKFQDQAESPFIIEFQIPKMASSQQKSFIEVPWELLANNNAFLAQHDILKYSPIRRLGPEKETKPAASEFRLNTVFMAASPRNVEPELDYEQEENALLNLGGGKALPMDLFVEESGNLGQLFDLVTDKKPDVVHISCHGNIFNENNQNQPYLCLEDNKGNKVLTTPNTFCQQFTQHKPKLLFLSACKTAQSHQFNEHTKDDMGSFSQTIIEHSFPAILGWSGSVSDMEATRFAAGLYRELSHAASLENAFAQARSLLFTTSESADPLQQAQKHESKDWHLARLYLGPDGGGEIAKGIKQGFNYEKDFGTKAFLGKKEQGNKVAGREEFVGRRRQIQDILKIFETQQKAGVLIHGIGNQGKSSLAARIANRLANYHTVLIYGKKGNERQYGRIYVLNTLKTVPGIARQTDSMIDKLIQEINQGQCSLKAALKELLEGPFSGKDKKHVPILMVVDDLEKLLNPPQQEQASYSV